MSFIREFVWLLSQSLLGCFVTPLLWIPLALFGVLTVLSFVSQRQDERRTWKHHWWIIFIQLLFLPAIVIVGLLGETFHGASPVLFEFAVCSLLVFAAVFGGVGIYRMKGEWSAIFLVVTQQFLLLGASFVAGMAITGDWL